MLDEFEVNVDDDSGFEVAEQIMRLRKDCVKGGFKEVEELYERWNAKKGKDDLGKLFEKKERNEEDDETDASEDEDEDEEQHEDVEMEDVPQLVRAREPVVPEVDDDGFTKVTKKKR